MITIYLGLLAVGVIAIVVVLLKENKGSKPSAVDLLNSLEIDENPDEEQKPKTPKPQSASFLNRFNLNDERMKKVEERIEPVEPVKMEPIKKTLAQSAQEFEKKIKEPELPKQSPVDLNSIDKSTNDNKPSSSQQP